ncbi:MAG: hypothetical protein ACREGF_03870, partial [Candidatus Saccharimonadales bacterium]
MENRLRRDMSFGQRTSKLSKHYRLGPPGVSRWSALATIRRITKNVPVIASKNPIAIKSGVVFKYLSSLNPPTIGTITTIAIC